MQFDTKIAVIVRNDLLSWQKLNVTAFTVSGVAGLPEVLGDPYEDASGAKYLPMLRQPVLVFAADDRELRAAFERALAEPFTAMSLYTEDLFQTGHDEANRAAVRRLPTAELPLVGLACRGPKKGMDRILKGLTLHT